MKKILILCTGNSCRSQMAEGLLSNFAPNFKVYSAGTKPQLVNAFAIKAMAEINIDISKNTSNHVDEFIDSDFDFVFTVCDNARDICPIHLKSKNIIHHNFIDPANAKGTYNEQLEVYVNVRNQLSNFFKDFVLKMKFNK